MGVLRSAADHLRGLFQLDGVEDPVAEKFLVGFAAGFVRQDQDGRRQQKAVAVLHEPHQGNQTKQLRRVIKHQGKRLFLPVPDGVHRFKHVVAASHQIVISDGIFQMSGWQVVPRTLHQHGFLSEISCAMPNCCLKRGILYATREPQTCMPIILSNRRRRCSARWRRKARVFFAKLRIGAGWDAHVQGVTMTERGGPDPVAPGGCALTRPAFSYGRGWSGAPEFLCAEGGRR